MGNPTSLRFGLSDGSMVAIDCTAPMTLETANEMLDYVKLYVSFLEKREHAAILAASKARSEAHVAERRAALAAGQKEDDGG